MENDILKYQKNGEILIVGDLNARTGTLNDFIENDIFNPNTDDTYLTDINWSKRNNSDVIVNKQGKNILDTCISHRLRILNGRKIGDFMGKLTCYQSSGASAVDYAITSHSMWENILSFQVQHLTPYSDHCPISVKLAVNITFRTNQENTNCKKEQQKKKGKPRGFLWTKDSARQFIKALGSKSIQSMIQNQSQEKNQNTVEENLRNFNNIIMNAAKLSLKMKSKKIKDK